MDPNTTGQPTPDGAPPAPPAAPGWGTPPPAAPNAPGWGAPPTTPTDPGWAAPPAWATTPPPSSGGTGLLGRMGGSAVRRVVGIVAVILVVAVGGIVYNMVANPDHFGQVLYSTTDQSNIKGCSVSDRVTTAKAGTPVWAVFMLTHRLSTSDTVVEEAFFNGSSMGVYTLPSDTTSGVDCLAVTDDLSSTFASPGTYEIKLTVGTDVVADGKLTITP